MTHKAFSAAELEREIEAFHTEFIPKLHEWLHSLEGRKFESLAAAQSEINTIVSLVRRAGRQLLYEGQSTTIAAVIGTRQRSPSIQLRSRKDGQRIILLNSVKMPLLSTGPITDSGEGK